MIKHWLWSVALLTAITGCEPVRLAPERTDLDTDSAKQAALGWLEQSGALDGLDDLELVRVDFDSLGMAHVRLQQLQGGVPVEGGQFVVHLDAATAQVMSVTDRVRRRLHVDTVPSIDATFADDQALAGNRMRGYPTSRELRVVHHDGEDRLAWLVQLEDVDGETPSRPMVVVDAHTGDELFRYDNLQTVRNRNTYSANNGTSLPGSLRRSEGQGAVGDGPVDAAHDNAGFVYDYYFNEQGRDSWDGAGATIVSTAHYSVSYDNAFWDGSQMVYGDGGFYFNPLSYALDVVGHEITHAITERTAGLIYSGESGGLNEATSDIMGAVIESYSNGWVVDSDTWLVGEDICKPTIGDALRYMSDPPLDGISIDDYADYYSGLDVHYSSGLANKAFYLIATDPSLDIQDAADLWFRALSFYMTPNTTFAQAADATEQAAADLFGAGSPQVTAVTNAWAAVGVVTLDWDVIATELGLSGATGTDFNVQYDLPPGAIAMAFSLAGDNGDADLYVRRGSPPTTSTYDCSSISPTSNERCEINPASAGTYYVLVHSYATFNNVDLTVEASGATALPEVCNDGVDNDGDGDIDCADTDCAADPVCTGAGEICDDGIDNNGNDVNDCFDADCSTTPACLLSGSQGSLTRFEIPTPAGAAALDISISGGTGDADLYVRFDKRVRPNNYDCRPYLVGNDESCVFDPAQEGVYYVALHGYSAYSDVALTVTPSN
ncbi:MAG: M4 family metallopeptidase [Myxococcota bacterium]